MSEFYRTELEKRGRFPVMRIDVSPVTAPDQKFSLPSEPYPSGRNSFIRYEFESNILIPVDSFSFTFAAPGTTPVTQFVRDGDIVELKADEKTFSTGQVDALEVDIDADRGVTCTLRGRDLMCGLEDQAAIGPGSAPIYFQAISITGVAEVLRKGGSGASATATRIRGVRLGANTANSTNFFGTNPGETKLSAFLRFLEGLNVVTYMDPDGTLVVAKPAFDSPVRGSFVALKTERRSNVLRARVIYNSTQIPNIILPLWARQEYAAAQFTASQGVWNSASRPAQLYRAGTVASRVLVTSNPSASDTKELNTLIRAPKSYLESLARMELARANMSELQVEVEVPGHYDPQGEPYKVDTTYQIQIEEAGVDEKMYLYGVKFILDESGQRTILSFCKLNTIVAGGPVSGVNG